ncbi:Na/Pi cotransporter family protein [Candidatus Gracilibacteria bacterium]|nr:MAG: Na/Pi cotransporter family protein [Candidatus Gracilibacteria bacterium]
MMKKFFGAGIVLALLWGFYQSKNFGIISGGIALFLFGMIFLGQGFRELTGGGFEKVLKKFTNRIWKSMTLGAVGAMVMQSSSLVTIIAISFLSADLIPLAQGIAISLGSNIGTTSGAWLMANLGGKTISISSFAMPIIVFGLLFLIQKGKNIKGVGNILLGIGIIFIGVQYIQDGFSVMKESMDLMAYSLEGFRGILVFTLIGITLTVLLQSSHASILLIMSALWANQVTFENALALTIGANIGTTFSGILGSINSNVNGKRLAIADVLSKVLTGIIFTLFIYQIIPIVELIASYLNFASEDAFKIAIFHTLFNILGVAIILPFYSSFVKMIERLLPEKNVIQEKSEVSTNIYLNGASKELAVTALVALLKETRHMYDNSIFVILKAFGLTKEDIAGEINHEEIDRRIKVYEGDIDKLYGEKIKLLFGEIMDYTSETISLNDEKYYPEFARIRRANTDIVETVKTLKHMQRNLIRFINSNNEEIQKQYKKIIFDIVYVLKNIQALSESESNEEKMRIIGRTEKYLYENDLISNGEVDKLIRNKLITNQMTTSLIKDTNYKDDICKKLLTSAEMVFNKEIFNEDIVEKKIKKGIFSLVSSKKKRIEKLKRQKYNLKAKLDKEKNRQKKADLKKELDEIQFIIEKFAD